MNILVLRTARRALRYALFEGQRREPEAAGRLRDAGGPDSDHDVVVRRLRQVRDCCYCQDPAVELDAIALRATFGGETFTRPTLVDDDALRRLEDLYPSAPLQLPQVARLSRCCRDVFHGVDQILVFETAFFADLPPQERFYGLAADLGKALGVRRNGFHGVFHQAACSQVARSLRGREGAAAPRVLSICLEPTPEVAAVIGVLVEEVGGELRIAHGHRPFRVRR